MKVQKIVFELYPSIIKRINSWVVPLMLILLYLSGHMSNSEIALIYISRIGLSAVHSISGFILVFALVVLVYDKIFYLYFAQPGDRSNAESGQTLLRLAIDVVFYIILGCISCLGLFLYVMRFFNWDPVFLDRPVLFIIHVLAGSFFIALIPIKYYLSMIKWYKDLMAYLREES